MNPYYLKPGEVVLIESDNHCERPGFFRAFSAASPDATVMCPLVGYCSPGGSFRTIRACLADTLKREPSAKVYRNGRLLNP